MLDSPSSPLNDHLVFQTPTYEPDIDLVTEFATLLEQRLRLPQDEISKLAHELVAKARFYDRQKQLSDELPDD